MPGSQCIKCKPYITTLVTDNYCYRQQITSLKEDINILRKKLSYYETANVEYEDITSDTISPDMLRISSFKFYVLGLISKIPILGYILNLFLSASHKRKLHAGSTLPHWMLWTYFYQSFIVDIFLRARSPKTIHRTTLLLSAYMLLGNMSEPCWRLLQRLKILVSKKYLETWITSQVNTLLY
jgi:hypothetical protein